jgi:uncharacterized protein (TIGR02453 family)
MPTRPARKSAPPAAAASAHSAHPYFDQQALDFLRKLKRNNRREWFQPRRETYERELKLPMLALIETITHGMTDYAPTHLHPPQKVMLRIYRDIRFSADKSPYKTNIAAWWSHHGAPRTSGSGYYFHLTATELVLAAGVYMPPKDQLLAIRRHLLTHHEEFRRLIEDKKLRAKMEMHDPATLSRPPKGFPADHPAIEWIKWRQWGVTATLPAEEALKPTLAATIGAHFKLAHSLVDFLNLPLISKAEPRKKRLFGLY